MTYIPSRADVIIVRHDMDRLLDTSVGLMGDLYPASC